MEDGVIADGVVVTDGDRISWVGSAVRYRGEVPLPEPSSSILLPGLIDLHCHGGAGAGFPNADADGAPTRTPARLLGLESERGSLAPGRRADIVVTDHQLRPRGVFVGGIPAETEGLAWKS